MGFPREESKQELTNQMIAKHTLPVIAVFMLSGAFSNAALVSQLGILDLTANGGINPNTGLAWQAGDQYRLAFYTSGGTPATSNDPAFYDNFATTQANLSTLGNGNITTLAGWTAMVWVNTDSSLNTDLQVSDPRVRSGTSDQTGGFGQGGAGVPVFAMNGTTAIARNNADIYNGFSNPFQSALNTSQADGNGNNTQRLSGIFYSPFLNQNGGGDSGVIHGANVWTGGFTGAGRALGASANDANSTYGSSNANTSGRVTVRFNATKTSSLSVYALSPLLTVTEAIPEPSTALLGSLGILALIRRRRN